MAESDVFAARFRDVVRFNGTENSTLYRDRDKCVLTRVAGGIRAVGRAGRPVVVPDANIAWLELSDEPKRG